MEEKDKILGNDNLEPEEIENEESPEVLGLKEVIEEMKQANSSPLEELKETKKLNAKLLAKMDTSKNNSYSFEQTLFNLFDKH